MSWLLIFGTISITLIIVITMKKNLTLSEIYTTVIFGLFIQTVVDTFASVRFKAWGFYEVEKIEFKALWIVVGIYPIFATMIINWFPYCASWRYKLTYLIAWDLFSTGFEWLSLKLGILWHINWNLLFSFILYPLIYYLLILHVRFYKWVKKLSLLHN